MTQYWKRYRRYRRLNTVRSHMVTVTHQTGSPSSHRTPHTPGQSLTLTLNLSCWCCGVQFWTQHGRRAKLPSNCNNVGCCVRGVHSDVPWQQDALLWLKRRCRSLGGHRTQAGKSLTRAFDCLFVCYERGLQVYLSSVQQAAVDSSCRRTLRKGFKRCLVSIDVPEERRWKRLTVSTV